MNLVTLFFAGMFFANTIPHFVHGISGKRFPTPFAKPPGKGLSPAPINVFWGLFNFLGAIVIFTLTDEIILGLNPGFIVFALGFVVASLGLSIWFQGADKER